MKTCTKCKQIKHLSEFNKSKTGKFKRQSWCRDCKKEHHLLNREKRIKAMRARWNDMSESEKQNRLELNKQYYQKYKKEILDQHREYVKKNCKKVRQYQKEYRKRNRAKLNEQANIRWKKRRAKKLYINEEYTLDDKTYTLDLFNHQCANCGSTDDLCVDHHKPLSKGFALTRENAVVLCNRCNCSKGDKMPEEFYESDVLKVIKEKLEIS
jgi:5-methylcytosine-specific restriction endonuclease McrA